MTAAEVEAALERLREAGPLLRERSVSDVLDALADALDAWSASGSPWQKALADALADSAGFDPATAREGLARGLAPWTGRALRELVRRELGDTARSEASAGVHAAGFDVTATVLAGAIPMPAILSIVAPLVLRSPVLVKPSAADPATAALFARSLAEHDALLGACVEIADFRSGDGDCMAALAEADCVVATGSDDAVGAVAAHVAPPRRFLGYGHRFSLALLGPATTRGAELEAAAEQLALDVALWDQLGCLSPVSVHAVDPDPRAADRVAEALAAALARAETRWPRGRVAAEAAAAIARERAEAEMRAAAGRAVVAHAGPGDAWTVVREEAPALRAAPLHRFVRVHPAAEIDAALDALRPRASHLACVALAGFGAATREVAAALVDLGASRVCAPGALQVPPISWPRDNQPVLIPLARWTEIEVA